MRIPTKDVTLNTWTVRIDGVDVCDIELNEGDVCGVRDLVADATGARVSLGLTANMRGVLLDLLAEE
jgi:hypothetical protein